MTGKNKAYIAAIMYSLIIGLSFMFVKLTLTVATPLDTLAHRFSIAWIAATIVLIYKKESLIITKKGVLIISSLAIFYPIFFFAFQIFGLVYTSSSEAGIIQAIIPIFTLILARILLKEKSTVAQKIAISFSVLGVIYIMYMNGAGGKNANILGSGLLLLSALSSSLYQVFSRKLTQIYPLFSITYIITLFGFIVFNSMALTNHLVNGTVYQFVQPLKHFEFVFAILYLGILSSLGTSYLTNYSLSQLPASQVSVFGNLATLFTILAGIFLLHESFHYYHTIGTFLIIIGIFGVNYFGKKRHIKTNNLATVEMKAD